MPDEAVQSSSRQVANGSTEHFSTDSPIGAVKSSRSGQPPCQPKTNHALTRDSTCLFNRASEARVSRKVLMVEIVDDWWGERDTGTRNSLSVVGLMDVFSKGWKLSRRSSRRTPFEGPFLPYIYQLAPANISDKRQVIPWGKQKGVQKSTDVEKGTLTEAISDKENSLGILMRIWQDRRQGHERATKYNEIK